MNYTKLLKDIQHFTETSRDKTVKTCLNPYTILPLNFIEAKLLPTLKEVSPVFTDEVFDTDATIEAITDPELQAAVAIAGITHRSKLLRVAAAKNPKYASLTPLLMLAMKEEHGVPYSSWDKNSKWIALALGTYLKSLINYTKPFILDIEEREEFIGDNPLVSYKGNATTNFKPASVFAKITTQTWIANAELRQPGYMILDVLDWDNVPDALDLVRPKVIKETKVKVVEKAKVREELPW